MSPSRSNAATGRANQRRGVAARRARPTRRVPAARATREDRVERRLADPDRRVRPDQVDGEVGGHLVGVGDGDVRQSQASGVSLHNERAREFTSTASTDAQRGTHRERERDRPHRIRDRRSAPPAVAAGFAQEDRGARVEPSVAEDAVVGAHRERHVGERNVDRALVGSRLRRLLEVVVWWRHAG